MTQFLASSKSVRRTAAWVPLVTAVAFAASATLAHADTGKLLLTGGVSSVEGAAGGGISPWAVIGTQATGGETGVSAFASYAKTQDYRLTVTGAAVAFNNRVELSAAHQDFDTGVTGELLGLPGLKLRQMLIST